MAQTGAVGPITTRNSTSYLLASSNGWDTETGLDYIQCTIKSMDSSKGLMVKGAGYGLGNQQEVTAYQT
jgi:hypothetical protein